MFIPKIKQSHAGLSEAKFIELCQQMIEGLTDNPFFPNIGTPLTEFKAVFNEYYESIPTKSLANEVTIATKNANRIICNRAMTRIIGYITYEANFNEDALKSTNLPMVKKPQPKGLVGLVHDINLKSNGQNGTMIVSCKEDPNAAKYYARVSTDEQNWFAFGVNTSRVVKVHGLPVGQKLYIQMQLENSHGVSPWSNSVTGRLAEADVVASIHN